MPEDIFSLVGRITLDGVDTANKGLDEVDKKASSTSSSITEKLGGIGKGIAIGLTAGTAAVGGIVAGALSIGTAYDDAYDAIRNAAGGSEEKLASLQNSFKSVVGTVGTDFGTATEAITLLNQRLDSTGKPLEDLSVQFINLSRITGSDLKTNIELGTRTFGDWSIATDKQSDAMDYLFKVSQSTGVGMDTLMGKVVQFGAPLRQLGFGFEESAILVGKWEKEGVNADLVFGSMRIALSKFAQEGVTDTHAAFLQVIKDIQGAGSTGEATAIAIDRFGAKAGPDMAAAIREGRFSVDDLTQAIAGSQDTINKASDATTGFAEKWQLFKNRAMNAIEPVAMGILGMAEKGIGALQSLADNESVQQFFYGLMDVFDNAQIFFLEQFIPTIQKLVPTFKGAFETILGIVGPIFTTIRDGVITFIQALSGNWADNPQITGFHRIIGEIGLFITGTLIPAIQQFATIIETNVWPIAQKVFGFVQEILGKVAVFVNDQVIPAFKQLSSFFLEVFGEITKQIGPMFDNLMVSIRPALDNIMTIVTTIFSAIRAFLTEHGEAIKAVIMAAWTVIRTVVETTVKVIADIINIVTKLIQGDWDGVWNGIKKLISDVWDGIKNIVEAAIGYVKTVLQLAWDVIDQKVKDIWNGIKGFLDGIWNGIKSLVESIFNGIRDFLAGIWDAISQKASDVWNSINSTVTGIINGFKGAIETAFNSIRDFIGGIWDTISQKAVDTWNGIKNWFTTNAQSISDSVTNIVAGIRDWLAGAWDAIKTKATETWDGIKNWFISSYQSVVDAAMAPFKWFRDNVGGVIDAAWGFIKTPLNAIIGGFEWIQHKVADILNWIFDKVGLGNPFGYISLGRLAQGTDNLKEGGLYQVAERGAELVYIPGNGWTLVHGPTEMFLPPGSKVIPAARTQRALNVSNIGSSLKSLENSDYFANLTAIGDLTNGIGRGSFIGDIVGGIGDLAGSVVSTVKDWVGKGASWVLDQAVSALGFDVSLPGRFADIIGGLLGLIKDKLKAFIQELIDALNQKVVEQEQRQAPANSAPGGSYSGNDAAVKEAFTQLGQTMSDGYDWVNGNHPWDMWCEAFVGSVAQHIGLPRPLYGSAAIHANSIPLSQTSAPAGTAAFWAWDTDGHTAISIGDGTYIGTSSGGIQVQVPALSYLGWSPLGVENGGYFDGDNPTPVWIGEGKYPEIASPVPVLDNLVRNAIQDNLQGIEVQFNGPTTINATDKRDAERSAQDFGFAAKQALRARGLA